MRVGIFGGSFDPIHCEHIALAKQAVADLSLDRLWIMPAAKPPHKPWRVLTSDEDRLAMCRLAFADEPKITVSDYEIQSGGTSYTYLTVRHFKQLCPEAELFFLMGTDMLRDFPRWKNPEDILKNAEIAVCARAEEAAWAEKEQAEFLSRFGKKFQVLSYEGKDVSSTQIRVLAAAGADVTPFVGEVIAEYVQRKGLYSVVGAKQALQLEKPGRRAHSIRVALLALKHAARWRLNEAQVVQACLLHDCAKSLRADNPLLQGFTPPEDCPLAVMHQYAGEYVARTHFGVTDEAVLSAIACHTSGKPKMTDLEKLVFLADLLEEERCYPGVERLRDLFEKDLDECLTAALEDTVEYLTRLGQPIYGKTLTASVL